MEERITANRLNESWIADEGWSSSLGVGLTNPRRKTLLNITNGLGPGRIIWINDLIWFRIMTAGRLL
jgi:hypothetical protein